MCVCVYVLLYVHTLALVCVYATYTLTQKLLKTRTGEHARMVRVFRVLVHLIYMLYFAFADIMRVVFVVVVVGYVWTY